MDGIHCAFQGTLSQDPLLEWAENRTLSLEMVLAVREQDGAGFPAEFIQVTLFGEQAEELEERLKEGTEVRVEGRLRLGA